MDARNQDCGCGHHQQSPMSGFIWRWVISLLIIMCVFVVSRPFIVKEMLLRASSYSSYSFYDDVIRICKKVVIIDKNNSLAWTSLGNAYKDMGDLDAAIRAYQRVFGLNPKDKGAVFDLGMTFYLKKDFANAILYLEKIRALGPDTRSPMFLDILNFHQNSLAILEKCYHALDDNNKAEQIKQEIEANYSGDNSNIRTLFRRKGKSE